MQRSMLAALFAATLVLPGSSAAQARPDEDVVLIRGLRVSPFVGFLTAYTRTEEWVFQEGETSAFAESELDIAGATAFGVQLEGPLQGRFALQGAAGYAARGNTDFVAVSSIGTGAFRVDGNHVIFLRGGAALHLREPESELVLRSLNASIFAGGVVMHERPRDRLGSAEFLESGTHRGLNMGVNAEVPFGADRFAVQLGVEDNMMWWDETQLRALAYAFFGSPGTTVESTRATADMAHTWLMRAGVQFRF